MGKVRGCVRVGGGVKVRVGVRNQLWIREKKNKCTTTVTSMRCMRSTWLARNIGASWLDILFMDISFVLSTGLAYWIVICTLFFCFMFHQVYWVGPLLGGVTAGFVYDHVFAANSSKQKFRTCMLGAEYQVCFLIIFIVFLFHNLISSHLISIIL